MAAPRPEALAPRLLAWFDRAQRDLPWRRSRDPYAIWISEVMLQQTQVDRVTAYYPRFLTAFPTVQALAAAPLDEVLRQWEGLGYYTRARHLHRAAQAIVAQHAGRFPDDYATARSLPGVGDYTAGAVLSIAYGQRLPALDANARRVLFRVFLRKSEGAAKARKRLDQVGAAAVPEGRPGDYTQALMELGALVCLPRNPKCEECCLADICTALRQGRPEAQAARAQAKRSTGRVALAVVMRNGKVLLAQRPEEGVWGGLWEFPNVELQDAEDPRTALTDLLGSNLGLRVSLGESVGHVTHGIMNRRLEIDAYAGEVVGGRVHPRWHQRAVWVDPGALAEYALPSPHRRLADMLFGGVAP